MAGSGAYGPDDRELPAMTAMWKTLAEAVSSRTMPVLWETSGVHLITQKGGIHGVVARRGGKEIKIRASRAVLLTCGGFEFNGWMKHNYLRVYPAHFTGNPGNTGDGLSIGQKSEPLWLTITFY